MQIRFKTGNINLNSDQLGNTVSDSEMLRVVVTGEHGLIYSQSIVPWPAALVSPGNLLDMEVLWPHPRPPASETLKV